jgi:hypothetical protein
LDFLLFGWDAWSNWRILERVQTWCTGTLRPPHAMTTLCTFILQLIHQCIRRCRVSIFKHLDETGGFFSGVFQEAQLSWRATDYEFFHLTSLQMKVPVCFIVQKTHTPLLTYLLCAIQVTTKLAGSQYNHEKISSHYFKIAACSMKNCVYWGEIMANNRDIQVLMQDEGLIPGYHASDEEDGGKPRYEESEEDSEEESDSNSSALDNRPLIGQAGSDSSDSDDNLDNQPLIKRVGQKKLINKKANKK